MPSACLSDVTILYLLFLICRALYRDGAAVAVRLGANKDECDSGNPSGNLEQKDKIANSHDYSSNPVFKNYQHTSSRATLGS